MYKKSAIKKISCVLLIVLLCILAACTAPTPIQTEPIQATSQTVPTQADGFSPHQELIATEAKFSLGFLGRGIGIVEKLLECYNISAFANLHNDLLKFYVELGFIGLGLYLASYIMMFLIAERYFGKSSMSYLFLVSIYTIIIFATDNISIYLIYLIPMYVTMFAVLSPEETSNVKRLE